MSVVIDIDNTLIDTRARSQRTMNEILSCEVSMHDMRNMTPTQIFAKYASSEQQCMVDELEKRFWDILLCKDDFGFELLCFDEPISHSAKVLESWNEDYQIVYLTGRIEPTREQTLIQLQDYGFPVDNAQLVMSQVGDYHQKESKSMRPEIIKTRSRLFSAILESSSILKVVDDFPDYFTIYRKHGIPELIGLAQLPLHTEQSFLDKGATRVIRCWSELLDS